MLILSSVGACQPEHALDGVQPALHCNADLMSVSALQDVTTGDTLCDEKQPIILERMEFPDPVIKVRMQGSAHGFASHRRHWQQLGEAADPGVAAAAAACC